MTDQSRLSTGIEGLDDILQGGLHAGHLYLIEGDPGTGKTTLACSSCWLVPAKGNPSCT